MSRVLKAMVALLAIAAIAAPAMAEDRLGLSGAMEVRGWYLDDGGDKTQTFADQRLRIGGKLSIAEGVSATFRTDFSESDEWGNDAAYGRQNIHVDRAHLDITKGMFSLRAGQQNFAFANSTVDAQDNGILIGINGMMPIQLGYMLTESNGGKASADSHILYASISHKTDAYSVTVYGANETSDVAFKNDAAMLKAARNNAYLNGYTAEDGTKTKGYNQVYSPATGVDVAASETQGDTALAAFDAENDITDYEDGNLATIKGEDVYVVGLTSSYNLGAVKLDVDLAHFFGDFVKSENIDVMGTQLMLNGSVAASEAVTVGAAFYYAIGADNDEAQVTFIGNGFNDWDPVNYGPLANENLFASERVYDFTGDMAGVIGGQLYANMKASDSLTLTGSAAYLVPEEDANTTTDSQLALNAGLSYALMANTTVAAQLQYVNDDAPDSDDMFGAGLGLYVNF